jgi:hypothetical protein
MTGPEDDDAPRLFERSGLRALVLFVAVVIAFGPAIDGDLVWDDAATVGVAARLPSPWAAFSRDLFDLGAAAPAGAGASWFRPLVTLSYALDVRVFAAAPHFGLHLVNLLWHALAAVLVARALERWTRAETPRAHFACSVAALFWAVLPAKAENVAWISGRGDVMGLALLLFGLEARSKLGGTLARMATAVAATAAALLCKEGFIAAPAIWAMEVFAEREDRKALPALRSAEVLASGVTVVAYLALRRAYLPIQGGGAAMFAGLSLADRAMLALETIGHAATALIVCFEAHLLRGPIGFSGPDALLREPGMAVAGGAFVLVLALAAWRAPRVRPAAALLAVTLFPVSNIIPAGLESRMSDRFLYVPSLAVALGMAALLASAAAFRAVALGLSAGAVGLMLVSSRRALVFRSSDALWSWERAHGDRATTVLHHAAQAALRGRDLAKARDLSLETAARYAELGFDDGYPYLVQAMAVHVRLHGEEDRASLAAYRRLLDALVAGRAGKVTFHLPDGRAVVVPTATPSARAYAAAHAREMRVELLVLDARTGREEAAAGSRAEVEACPRCRGVIREAVRIELALAHPDPAKALLDVLGRDPEADEDLLPAVAAAQARELAAGGDLAKARALFLGEAYAPACKLGEPALATAPPDRPEVRTTIAVACVLAGDMAAWQRIRPTLSAAAVQAIDGWSFAWRSDPRRRLELFGDARPR